MTQEYIIFYYYLGSLLVVTSINPFKEEAEVDYSASAFDVKKLVRVEQKLLNILVEYKNDMERKLNLINKYLEDFKSSVISNPNGNPNGSVIFASKSDLDTLAVDIINHPIKTYRLFRRFVQTLPTIEMEIGDDRSADILVKISSLRKLLKFPKFADLEGAVFSLIRLKQTFNIPVKELAKGNLNGLMTNSGLSSQNCFEIGQKAMEQEVLSTAIDFFDFALNTAKPSEFLETRRALRDAIKIHDKYLLFGNFDRDENPFHFTGQLYSYKHKNFKTRRMDKTPFKISQIITMRIATEAFEKLCRQETIRDAFTISSLKCVHLSGGNTHPFYILNPLQVEVQNMNPPIVQIYNVLSEREIEMIKREAQPELSRSRTLSLDKKNPGNITYFRTSSSTWISDDLAGSPFEFVNKRVEMITGLTLKEPTAKEILQVGNYAPGGFYTPHYDAIHEPFVIDTLDPREFEIGDRIATFMIYISEVERGGATAFPLLGVSIQPIKGSAVFWYNLYSDGSINRLMLHGGCPILYGNKWVVNKWIRSNDQMFKRKCPTTQSKDVWI